MAAAHSKRLLSLFAGGALLATGASASAQTPPPPPPPPPEAAAPPVAEPPPPPPPAPVAPVAEPAPAAAVAPAPAPSAAPGGLKIEGNNATGKVGFLLQPAFEAFNTGAAGTKSMTNNLYIRRARLMVGFSLGSDFELFAETDSPNLNRQNNGGAPLAPVPGSGVNIQDAYMTYKPMDEFKLDVGMMLIPFSHNSLQGATTLYGLEYFRYAFVQSGAFGNFAGRDTGIQARGLIAKMVEYRIGAFEGKRNAAGADGSLPGRNSPRIAARVQVNLMDPETGFFYAGTYGGTKKVLSIGGGWDHQDTYNAFAGDLFADIPIGEDVVTAQFIYEHLDGKTGLLGAIPKQDNIMAEAGYRIGFLKLSPIVRFEWNKPGASGAKATNNIGGGLAYWYMNHNANVKVFYMNSKLSGADKSANAIILQTQFYVF